MRKAFIVVVVALTAVAAYATASSGKQAAKARVAQLDAAIAEATGP